MQGREQRTSYKRETNCGGGHGCGRGKGHGVNAQSRAPPAIRWKTIENDKVFENSNFCKLTLFLIISAL